MLPNCDRNFVRLRLLKHRLLAKITNEKVSRIIHMAAPLDGVIVMTLWACQKLNWIIGLNFDPSEIAICDVQGFAWKQ